MNFSGARRGLHKNIGYVGKRFYTGQGEHRERGQKKQIPRFARNDNYLNAGAGLGRRWRVAPRRSQTVRAIHSARLKWPGKAGTSFIRTKRRETQMPRVVIARMRRRGSTSQKEAQAASQPSAEAMEPTSVTGTRIASPSSRPTRVPAV